MEERKLPCPLCPEPHCILHLCQTNLSRATLLQHTSLPVQGQGSISLQDAQQQAAICLVASLAWEHWEVQGSNLKREARIFNLL